MAKPDIGAGNVPIELGGNIVELVPTVEACQQISKTYGGLNAAIQRCMNLDFDTICQIIIAGISMNPTQAKQIPKMVFEAGTINLSAPCITFIHVIANGGQPLDDDEVEQADPLANPSQSENSTAA